MGFSQLAVSSRMKVRKLSAARHVPPAFLDSHSRTTSTHYPPPSPTEEALWGAAVARGFSHRPGDPQRFLRKLRADAQSPRTGVRVVVDNATGTFVGALRVLERSIDVDGRSVRIAGLAEVCSDPAWRGRGVASVSMADARDTCAASGAALSLLHAAPAVASMYERLGYRPLVVPYALLPPGAAELPAGAQLQRVELSDPLAAARLSALHTAACAALAGCMGFTLRSSEYWTRWLPAGAAGGAFCALQLPGAPAGAPAAFAVAVLKDGVMRLWDYGAVEGLPPALACAFLRAVAARAAADGPPAAGAAAAPAEQALLLPTPLARLLCSEPLQEVGADEGWMIRPLNEEGEGLAQSLTKASAEGRFLVWAADAF